MLGFLALTEYEEYNELAVNYVLQSKWINPYDISLLLDRQGYFFPVNENFTTISIWMILAAILLFWFGLRVNRAHLYKFLAAGLALLGLDFAFGMHKVFPSVLALLTALAAVLFLLAGTVIFLTVLGVRYLPYFGVSEQWIMDLKSGDVTLKAMFVFSALSLTLFHFGFFKYFAVFIRATLGYSLVWYWLCAILLLVFGAYAAHAFLPWTLLEEHPVLGGGCLKEISNIFAMEGEADIKEVVTVGGSVCVLFVGLVLAIRGSVSWADIFGFICMLAICLLLGRAIIHKQDKEEVVVTEVVNRKRNMWN